MSRTRDKGAFINKLFLNYLEVMYKTSKFYNDTFASLTTTGH